MAPTAAGGPMSPEQKAITEAKSLFLQLNGGGQLFKDCVSQATSVSHLVQYVEDENRKHARKSSSRLLEKFQRNTEGLQSLSSVIELAVQAKADCLCPLWAPVKFILQISKSHSLVVHNITAMVQVLTENLSRIELYQNLQNNPDLQTELLRIFNDVTSFCVKALVFFQRRTFVWKLAISPPKKNFQNSVDQLKSHMQGVHNTAVAIELAKQHEYRREQDRLAIINRLGATNVREVHQRKVEAKAPNTCEWILSHPTFVAWEEESSQEASERFLFISGKSGCGKSILASSIIDTFDRQKKRTMYFYFSGLESSRQDADSLVRWFLLDVLPSTTEETVQTIKLLFAKGEPTSSELRGALSSVMATLPTPLYLVIDGIDEIQGPVDDLFVQLRDIIDKFPRTKAVFLGRPHAFEGQASAYWIRISNDLLQADIRTFITTETQKSALLQQPNVHERVIKELLGKADGMFLWARLSINELCGAYSQDDVKQILKRLPLGVENAFNRILQEIVNSSGETAIQRAKYILRILVASARSLELTELQHACAVATQMNQDEFEREPLDAYKGPDPATMFLRACRGLIVIENGKVGLVHLTAREYLTRPAMQWDSGISCFRIDAAGAHEFLADVCIKSITSKGFEWFHSREGFFVPQDLEYPPLFSYAFRFMAYHFNRMGDPEPETVARIQRFFNIHRASWFEMFMVSCFQDGHNAVTTQDFLETVEWMDEDSFNAMKKAEISKEQFKRTCQEHAGNNWQSQRLHLLNEVFGFLDETKATAPRSAVSPSTDNTPLGIRAPISPVQENLSQVVQLLADHATLSLPKQRDLISRFGQLLCKQGRMNNLLGPFELLFRLFKSKINSFPTTVLFGFAELCRSLERPQNAIEIFDIVLSRLDDEGESKYDVWERIGHAYSNLDDHERAFNSHHSAWTGRCKILGHRHLKTARSTFRMGLSRYQQDRLAEAEGYWRQCLAIKTAVFGLEHKETSLTICWLGHAILLQERFADAEDCFRQIAPLMEATSGKVHRAAADSLFWLGQSIFQQSRFAEAEIFFRRAAAKYWATLGPSRETAETISCVGDSLYYQHQFTKAEEQYRRSQQIIDQIKLSWDDGSKRRNPLRLGQTLCCQLKFSDAEDIFSSYFTASTGRDRVNFEGVLWLARVLHYQQKNVEAERVLTILLPKVDGECDVGKMYSEAIVLLLGRVLNAQGRYGEAESILRQAVINEASGQGKSARTGVGIGSGLRQIMEDNEGNDKLMNLEPLKEHQKGEGRGEGEEEGEEEVDAPIESEVDAKPGEDCWFSGLWVYCNTDDILSEYCATGHHLKRQGKVAEAEEVYQLLKSVGWM
ncbi:hypothetical protein M440DRAFT_1357020 [Trichoderma longibrachiatum ATCC 18648]|uniref:NACHT domain-containing protein n=1 Tax=Trichoderma longibrachiatum ATCC 18648 TaxID=983965 RepID=A0A2T4C237_TRILO|nr:hypothetical protein M440DRAFT_1357020 [Trichoderma longibrachiatum ATCC 18648]